MSADIETVNGQVQTFVGNKPAWWGIGIDIAGKEFVSLDEFYTALPSIVARVTKAPNVAVLEDGTQVPTGGYATVRDAYSMGGENYPAKVLGRDVSERYPVLQNVEAFGFAADLIEAQGACVVTGGNLADGRQSWILLRMPETVKIGGLSNEEIATYVLVANSFDGSLAYGVYITQVRVVCANTLAIGISGSPRFLKLKHTGTLDGKLATARATLQISFDYGKGFEQAAERLLQQTISDAEFDAFLESLVPSVGAKEKERIDAVNAQSVIRDLYNETPDLVEIRGSKWAALQSVSDYQDHRRYLPAEARFRQALMTERSLTQSAYDLLAV